MLGAPCGTVICESWYGTEVENFAVALSTKLTAAGQTVRRVSAAGFFLSPDQVSVLKHQWITDEPAFGRVNDSGTLDDYLDPDALETARQDITAAVKSGETVVISGVGASFGCSRFKHTRFSSQL